VEEGLPDIPLKYLVQMQRIEAGEILTSFEDEEA
jgi:hypothetical protein